MTLDQYAEQVGSALRDAHNNKDMAALDRAFANADRTLTTSKIGDADRKVFWPKVRKAAFSGRWLKEAQANSSLLALMQAIETGLSARSK